MRVIVWGINYAPEVTGIAPHSVALCEFLHARGDDVSMVTGFAYYPSWEKRPGDRFRLVVAPDPPRRGSRRILVDVPEGLFDL